MTYRMMEAENGIGRSTARPMETPPVQDGTHEAERQSVRREVAPVLEEVDSSTVESAPSLSVTEDTNFRSASLGEKTKRVVKIGGILVATVGSGVALGIATFLVAGLPAGVIIGTLVGSSITIGVFGRIRSIWQRGKSKK